jgi:uncharacterized protein (UPF0147 family)
MEISIDFKVRDARKTLRALQEIANDKERPFEEKVRTALASALTKYDVAREVRRREREVRERLEKEQREARAQCAGQGHVNPIQSKNGILCDALTIPGVMLHIPACPRCDESLVHLKDGTWMNWLKWTETKPVMELDPQFLSACGQQFQSVE